jgi:hypothetical protein
MIGRLAAKAPVTLTAETMTAARATDAPEANVRISILEAFIVPTVG